MSIFISIFIYIIYLYILYNILYIYSIFYIRKRPNNFPSTEMERSLSTWLWLFWRLSPVNDNSRQAVGHCLGFLKLWPVGMTGLSLIQLHHIQHNTQSNLYWRAWDSKPSLSFLIAYDHLSFPNVATELFRDAVWAHIPSQTMWQTSVWANIPIYKT